MEEATYIHLNGSIQLDTLLEINLKWGAEGIQRGKKLPLGSVAINLDGANVQVTGV